MYFIMETYCTFCYHHYVWPLSMALVAFHVLSDALSCRLTNRPFKLMRRRLLLLARRPGRDGLPAACLPPSRLQDSSKHEEPGMGVPYMKNENQTFDLFPRAWCWVLYIVYVLGSILKISMLKY
jgi:hypothetical protein